MCPYGELNVLFECKKSDERGNIGKKCGMIWFWDKRVMEPDWIKLPKIPEKF